MSLPRGKHTATLLPNGKVLVTGGTTTGGGWLDSAELYDPVSGKWSFAGTMSSPHAYHSATLLRNGHVLVGQGSGWEIYNPDLGSWTHIYGGYLFPIEEPTATLLFSGQVLVTSGDFSSLFTAATGTFNDAVGMNVYRQGHTATPLSNGKVLVAGGEYQAGPTAEVYDPEPPPKVKLPRLLAFFPFEGNAKDASGNGRDGTLSSPHSPSVVQGYEGQAYYFNGGADYIAVPLNINPAQYPKLTMGAWVKTISSSTMQPVLTHDNGGYDRSLCIDYRGSGIGWSAFCGPDRGVMGAVPAIYQKWVFAAVVYDQTNQTVRLQVDDMVLTQQAATLYSGQNQMYIGASPMFNNFFDGVIDNVFIFGDALTGQQLTYIRSGGAQAIMTATENANPALFLLLTD